MEMTMCFPLLLLICSLCTAQLQTESDNQIIPLGKQTEAERREPTNAADQQQRCTQDIGAVLREMSASLAEQRVEMRHVQRENEVQAAKLNEQKTELEKQKTEMEKQKTEMEKLKQQLQAQTAELISIKARTNVTENQVEALKRDGEAQTAELISIKARTNVTENQVEALKREGEGSFIAPVRGAYHFELHIGAHGHASHPSSAALNKNGHQIFVAYEHQPSYFGKSSNGITLLLEVGDVVSVHLRINSRVFDNENHHSTFSGHLLFTIF
ncbi:uncharacterized protein [Pagrus major]|uniref:uncharacterized protein n=1 Tax=Pagrus major TaxID=143350 RepID=UPI003CC88C5B